MGLYQLAVSGLFDGNAWTNLEIVYGLWPLEDRHGIWVLNPYLFKSGFVIMCISVYPLVLNTRSDNIHMRIMARKEKRALSTIGSTTIRTL